MLFGVSFLFRSSVQISYITCDFIWGQFPFPELGSNKLNHISLGSFDYVATLLVSMGSFHGPNALLVIVYDLL